MTIMILGLIVFLGIHSTRMLAPAWREGQVLRRGGNVWKGTYSLISIAGLILVIWGFGMARGHPVMVYVAPVWLRHLNALFTLLAFILVAAAYIPGNHVKARLGHPMLAGVCLWAIGHLLATGSLRDLVLFGAFLVWAFADLFVSGRRDRRAGVEYGPARLARTLTAAAVGIGGWVLFAFGLHAPLIGVSPFG